MYDIPNLTKAIYENADSHGQLAQCELSFGNLFHDAVVAADQIEWPEIIKVLAAIDGPARRNLFAELEDQAEAIKSGHLDAPASRSPLISTDMLDEAKLFASQGREIISGNLRLVSSSEGATP